MNYKHFDQVKYIELWLNKVIRQKEAAKQLSVSIRHFRRLVRRYEAHGPQGLISKKGLTSNRKIAPALKHKTLDYIRKEFWDYGPTLAAEKLDEHYQIKLSKETIRQWKIEIGLHTPRPRKDKIIHEVRARRPCKGELIQVDGSHHDWFEGRGPECTLLVYIDDATSNLMNLEFAPGETTSAYMKSFKKYVIEHGIPKSLYTDKHNVFKVNDPNHLNSITQFGRILKELDIEAIFAHSPEAKGRVERANRTLQDRLVKGLRRENISDIDSANKYLKCFIREYNDKFSVMPQSDINIHRPLSLEHFKDIDILFSKQHMKKVFKGLIIKHEGKVFKLKAENHKRRLLNNKVLLCEKPNGEIDIYYKQKKLDYDLFIKSSHRTMVMARKNLDQYLDIKSFEEGAA